MKSKKSLPRIKQQKRRSESPKNGEFEKVGDT